MRKSRLNIPRKLTHMTAKFSTIWKQCVSITETMLCLYAVMMIGMEDKPRKIEDFYEAYKEVETPLGSPWLGEFYTMRQKALVFGPNEKDEYLYFWLTRNGTVGYLGYSFLRKFIKKQLTKPVIPFKKKKQNREEYSYSSNLSASLFQQELKNNLEYFVKTGKVLSFLK